MLEYKIQWYGFQMAVATRLYLSVHQNMLGVRADQSGDAAA